MKTQHPSFARTHTVVLLLLSFSVALRGRAAELVSVPVSDLGQRVQLISKLGSPLGAIVTVTGEVIDNHKKGYEGGLQLSVETVSGTNCPGGIRIGIEPYLNSWDDKDFVTGVSLPELRVGSHFEMEGYVTGGYNSFPREVIEKAGGQGRQISGHYRFYETFVVFRAKQLRPSDKPGTGTDGDTVGKTLLSDARGEGLRHAMEQVIIPSLELKRAHLSDALRIIEEYGTTNGTPMVRLRLGVGPLITLNLRDVSMLDALRYVSEVTDFRCLIKDPNVIVLEPVR